MGLSLVYYIAVSLLRVYSLTNSSYALSVSLVPHVVLSVNSSFISETPLLSGQIRYFELYQPPFISVNLSFSLSVADTSRFGNLYANVLPMDTPDSYLGSTYPSPNSVNGGYFGNQFWMLGNSSFDQTGQQNATFSSSCTASYRCVWRIALFAPRPQALLNYNLSVADLSSSPLRPSTRLFNGTVLDVTLTADRVLPLSFYVPSNTSVSLTMRWSTAPRVSVSLAVSQSIAILQSGASEVPIGTSSSPGNYSYTIAQFDQSILPFYGGASNVGQPFAGDFYARVSLPTQAVAMVNVTISLVLREYSGTRVLAPLALTPDTPHFQQLNHNTQGYFSFTTPPTLDPSSDVVFSVWPRSPSFTQPVYLSLWWSTTEPFPSASTSWNGSLSASSPAHSILWSATTSSSLLPTQTVYVSVLSQRLPSILGVLISFGPQRLTLNLSSGTGTTGSQGIVPAGYVGLVDLIVPTTSPSPSLSFVAGVVVDRSHNTSRITLPPFLLMSSWLSSGIPTLSDLGTRPGQFIWVSLQQINYYLGDYTTQLQDSRCQLVLGVGCVYHLMAFFSEGATDWRVTISDLVVSTTDSSLPPTALPIAPNTSIASAWVGSGEVVLYNLSIPVLWIERFTVDVTLTPLDAGNPDLMVTGWTVIGGGGNYPVLAQSLLSSRTGYKKSINITGVDRIITWAGDATMGQYGGSLSALLQISVTGTTAARYSLSVVTTGVDTEMPVAGTISLSSHTTTASVFVNQTGTTSNRPLVYAIHIGSDVEVTDATNLLINAFVVSPTNVSTAGNRPQVSLSVFPSYPVIGAYSSYLLPTIESTSYDGTAALLNTGRKVSLSANATYFVMVQLYGGRSTYHLVVNLHSTTPLLVGQVVHHSLIAGGMASYSLTLPARKVNGQFFTAANFTAAVSSLPTSGALPGHWLYQTVANTVKPFNQSDAAPWKFFNWRTTKQAASAQTLTTSEMCTISACTWTAVVYCVLPNTSYTFSFAPLPDIQKLVPGLTTRPHYIAADHLTCWSFTLPHPQMRVNVTLRSLLRGVDGSADANADLFFSRRSPASLPLYIDASSRRDDPSGVDSVSLEYLNATTGYANTTFYVSVFGQRAANYTLTVTAEDVGLPPTVIGGNRPVVGVLTAGSAQCYRFSVGTVAAANNVSVLLSTNCSTCSPQLFATFSYSRPGPLTLAGETHLPPFLPYESFALRSVNVSGERYSQLSLAEMPLLSSSNIAPLQSQSWLYLAVYDGAGEAVATEMPYTLLVDGKQWLTLTADASHTATGVVAGAESYYQFTFLDVSAPGQRVLLALIGLVSPASQLPSVYISDPSISGDVDPVVSSPTSYSLVLSPSTTSSSAHSLQSLLSADCASFPASSTCLYKALVLSTFPLSSYTLGLTTFTANDQQLLPVGSAVLGTAATARFRFFAFNVTADLLSLNVTFTTTTPDGSAELFMSTLIGHPNAASVDQWQWSSMAGGDGHPTVTIAVNQSDSRWRVGEWFVSVLGHRAAQFSLLLSVERSHQPAPPPVEPTKRSGGSLVVLLLATAVPMSVLILAAGLLLLYCYKARRGFWASAWSGEGGMEEPFIAPAGDGHRTEMQTRRHG